MGEKGRLHHLEFYVDDLETSIQFWGWLLSLLDYEKFQVWPEGRSWRHPCGTYLVFVQVKAPFVGRENNRQGRGLNHLAFTGLEALDREALRQGLRARGAKILRDTDTDLCFEEANRFAVELFANDPR